MAVFVSANRETGKQNLRYALATIGFHGDERMGDILPFKKPQKKTPNRGMCQHGFHRWLICKEKRFDVKQGKLVTVYRCERCGKEKVKTH
jgi:hypothetical protein